MLPPMTLAQTHSSPPLSITGKHWVWRAPGSHHQAAALSQQLGLSPLVAQLLVSRGITDGAAIHTFLHPSLQMLPDPNHLKDMEAATKRLQTALAQNEKIAVFGDYDVDGACATALLLRYFRLLGVDPELYIPDRLTEGYGPTPLAMQRLHERGAKVVMTVDCGSVALEALAEAATLGLDVIVTDHHQMGQDIPACTALINPHRPDETTECTNLAGTGVAFYLVMALNRVLRESGFFKDRPEPDLKQLLDLVAIATVCDVMPLTGVNRVLVNRGLQVLNQWQNAGLKALADVAGVTGPADAYHAGFVLGPRLNAAGRIDDCTLGATLLSCDDPATAASLAERLQKLNIERQTVEKNVLEEALAQAETQFDPSQPVLVVTGNGWHPGVVGIVASRVKEKFNRATFILGIDEDGVAKGSGRSLTGIDLGAAVRACKSLLTAGGGHAMAAGVTLPAAQVAAFARQLNQEVATQLESQDESFFLPRLTLDAPITTHINPAMMENLQRLAPFGPANPTPRFVITGTISYARTVGAEGQHVKCTVKGQDGHSLGGIAFRAMENDLGDVLLNSKGQTISVVGTLKTNTFNGITKTDLMIEDAALGKAVL